MSLRFSFLIILASTDFEKMSEKMINMFKGERLFWGGGGGQDLIRKRGLDWRGQNLFSPSSRTGNSQFSRPSCSYVLCICVFFIILNGVVNKYTTVLFAVTRWFSSCTAISYTK